MDEVKFGDIEEVAFKMGDPEEMASKLGNLEEVASKLGDFEEMASKLGDPKNVAFKSKSSIISSLAFYSNLMKTQKWTDCVLVGGDGVRVPAHMLMLAAHSSYLAQLLKLQWGHGDVCLVIPSLPGQVIKDIVGIMYGEIAVDLWGAGGKRILEAAQLLGCHYIDKPDLEEEQPEFVELLDRDLEEEQHEFMDRDLEEEQPEMLDRDLDEEQPEIVELLDRDLAEHLYQDVAHVAQQLGEVVEDVEDWDLFEQHLETAPEQEIEENDFKVIKNESKLQQDGFVSAFCSTKQERSSVIVSTNKIKTTLCILEEKEMKATSVSTQNTYLSPKESYLDEKASNKVAMTKKLESRSRKVLNRRHDTNRRDIQLPGLPPDSHQSAINEITILCSEHIQPRRRRLLRLALTCKGCNKVFMSGSQLEEHVGQDHGDEGDMFGCVLHCNVAFNTFSLLCHHSTMVHKFNLNKLVGQINMDQAGDKKEFKCRLCGEKFMYGRGLQRHFRLDHDGELPFECGFCGHQTSEISRYNRHLVCHQVARQREYCDICFKEFRNKVSLKTHRNMVHKLGKKYPCSHCNKVLYSSQYLKKHEATHEGIRFREVICKYCGKSIEYSKIKNHELTHTGEKPFQCPECNYRCIQRSNLRIHMKGVHGTELPRLALGQKRYSGKFMDGTAGNTDPFDLRSIFHNKSL